MRIVQLSVVLIVSLLVAGPDISYSQILPKGAVKLTKRNHASFREVGRGLSCYLNRGREIPGKIFVQRRSKKRARYFLALKSILYAKLIARTGLKPSAKIALKIKYASQLRRAQTSCKAPVPTPTDPPDLSYSLLISAENGKVLKDPDQTVYQAGTQVLLTAIPNSGFQFGAWSGDGVSPSERSNASITVIMNGNKSLTAGFAPLPAGECFDGLDNDGNGKVDFDDFGCLGPNAQETNTDNGWTLFYPSADTLIVYVSSSQGDDANNGLSSSASVKTLMKAKTLVRDEKPDWLLLKRGDTFSGGEGLGHWTKSGRSPAEPMLIASYGTSTVRPIIKAGNYNGIYTQDSTRPGNNVAIVGLYFYANTRDPKSPDFTPRSISNANGISWMSGSNILVEDTVTDGFATNIIFSAAYGPVENVTVRRCVIINAYAVSGHSQGLFVGGVKGRFVIEDNVFDHNGWSELFADGEETIFNHNIYISSAEDLIARNNILARASSHGLQARHGGDIIDNLFLRNSIGLSYGLVNGGSNVKAGGVWGSIERNVFIETKNIGALPRGYSLELGNIKPGANTTLTNNIFAHPSTGAVSFAMQFGVGDSPDSPIHAVGINDLLIENNIVYGFQCMYMGPNLTPGGRGELAWNNVTFRNNQFQEFPGKTTIYHRHLFDPIYEHWEGNSYNSTLINPAEWFYINNKTTSWDSWKAAIDPTGEKKTNSYPDPDRSVGNYHGSLGRTATTEAFLEEAIKQSRFNWRPEYTATAANDYIRVGFGMSKY